MKYFLIENSNQEIISTAAFMEESQREKENVIDINYHSSAEFAVAGEQPVRETFEV